MMLEDHVSSAFLTETLAIEWVWECMVQSVEGLIDMEDVNAPGIF